MRYFTVVRRGQDRVLAFAQALTSNVTKPASVFVVGVSDVDAFSIALIDGNIEGDELDAKTALSFTYSEAIGTEDHSNTLTSLLAEAKQRIEEIERLGTTRIR